MRINKVVTSFLKFKGKILILRRSDEVLFHKGRWAGISGFMEKGENPLETATREIKEETGLKGRDFELLKEGTSFSFDEKDEESNIKWIIHPFLFKAKTNKIKIDKEHFEFRWIKPEELAEYFTVPKLNESLKRVL